MNICVYGASSNEIDKRFLDATELLGEEIGKRGHNLVFGGGASGVMGAAARGTKRENGGIYGISPHFFNVDGILYQECTELIYTETMRERKKILSDMSDGFVIAPGGVGTLDEFFEVLTLKQLQRHNKPIVILNTLGFYDDMINMLNKMAEMNFMKTATTKLFKVTDDISEAISYIENYDEEQVEINKLKNI